VPFFLLMLSLSRGVGRGGGIYVIKEWHVTKSLNATGNFVSISGRREGLIAWFLALINIDPTIRLNVSQRNFTLEARTFWGFSKCVIPLAKVSEIRSGFAYPWFGPMFLAMFALFCFLVSLGILYNNDGVLGFLFMIFMMFVCLGLATFIYVYKRSLELGVVGSGGSPAGIRFRPSFIEGKYIEAVAAEKVVEIIHELIDLRQEGEETRKHVEQEREREEERKRIAEEQERKRKEEQKRIEEQRNQRQEEEQRRRLAEVQEQNREYANTAYREARAMFRAEQFDRAMVLCNAILQTIPHAHTFLLRAMLWEKQEKYKEMLEDCTRAIDLDSNLQNAYWVRATALKRLIETSTWNRRQRRDDAVADLSKITPDNRLYAQAQNLIQDMNSYF